MTTTFTTFNTGDLTGIFGALELVSYLIFFAISIISLIIGVLCLRWAINNRGGTNTDIGPIIVTYIICALIANLLPCIGCFISAFVIQSRHDLEYGQALLAYILAGLIPFLIAMAGIVVILGLAIGFTELMGLFGILLI